ncbi:MAG TPA: biotin/lipoyl-containing protein [Candidatus Dormibacteraeota bacterium]|nr:biotin/lipoyl-containing protein [Candidatus Dormibacteraeota bacterium]
MATRGSRRAAVPDTAGAAEQARGDALAMQRLSEAVLPALIARFEASGLGELEVRRGDWRVRLRKPDHGEVLAAPAAGGGAIRAGGDGASGAGRSGVAAASAGRGAALSAVGPGRVATAATGGGTAARRTATSPAVGYYMPVAAMTPGRLVRAGDVVGYVDVLGVRQEVVAPLDGAIARVLAELGQAVEYGQELVRLDAAPPVAPGLDDEPLAASDLPPSEA